MTKTTMTNSHETSAAQMEWPYADKGIDPGRTISAAKGFSAVCACALGYRLADLTADTATPCFCTDEPA